ncbi:hypothetical protein BegalDRAFT_0960 [Beggiatoa alba B18LD]|uniref:Uncharacterized protein n=1 Tax=Beggiatoa alba B18LD TaxID=395493 RepID=I3CE23_9GAMM|nr:hypothetical protein [Beggiatoa alba]EIJ41866.1 hypothetical protein BegalDRAFT_0960 [Beggiatoa alba B18LD]
MNTELLESSLNKLYQSICDSLYEINDCLQSACLASKELAAYPKAYMRGTNISAYLINMFLKLEKEYSFLSCSGKGSNQMIHLEGIPCRSFVNEEKLLTFLSKKKKDFYTKELFAIDEHIIVQGYFIFDYQNYELGQSFYFIGRNINSQKIYEWRPKNHGVLCSVSNTEPAPVSLPSLVDGVTLKDDNMDDDGKIISASRK